MYIICIMIITMIHTIIHTIIIIIIHTIIIVIIIIHTPRTRPPEADFLSKLKGIKVGPRGVYV